MRLDLTREPIGQDAVGRPVMLSELWPDDATLAEAERSLHPALYAARAADTFLGPPAWQKMAAPSGARFPWEPASTFLRPPPFATGPLAAPQLGAAVTGTRILALLGDDVTTDHIPPVSRIPPDSEAATYLRGEGTPADDLQSYSARRVNHAVMARGSFANIRLRNRLVPGRGGGFTRRMPGGETATIHEAAQGYAAAGVAMVIVAGHNYGAGSARDWAAKGTRILGVRAVIAESFERIHCANLVAMGVLPLVFPPGVNQETLGLTGEELVGLPGLPGALHPGGTVQARFRDGARCLEVALLCRIETAEEAEDLRGGGILPRIAA